MREEMQQRVEKAVKELNYRPTNSARSLRQSRLHSIGMIIVDVSPHYLSDGYTTQIVSGLSNFLNSEGYTLQLEGIAHTELARSSLIQHIRTDALCLMLSGRGDVRREQIETIKTLTQPVVVFLEQIKTPGVDMCCVVSSDREGGRILARHLLDHDAKKIAVLISSTNYWKSMHVRYDGAAEVIEDFGKGTSIAQIDCGDGSFEQTRFALEEAVRANGMPDAIMAVNDQIGIAALKYLHSINVAVPGQVHVTGFNAFDWREFSFPVLTSICSPGYEMGQAGGREIINRVNHGEFSRKLIKLPVKFMKGDST